MRKHRFAIVVLLASLALLLGGLNKLVQLRFETGEAYPVRSSFRPDPLGSKVLYESYSFLPGLTVGRNFYPFHQLKKLPEDSVLLLLNVHGVQMYQLADYDSVLNFINSGGRLVIAMNSSEMADQSPEEELDESSEPPHSESEELGENGEKSGEEEETQDKLNSLNDSNEDRADVWGNLKVSHGFRTEGEALLVEESLTMLPASLPWRLGGLLEGLGDEWRALYQSGDEVVAAERSYGKGSIVVLTDDYLFSNEGLLKHRFSDFLVWVLKDKKRIIFDETHLGVTETVGISTLIRRYHLSGFFIGLFAFLFLVAWRGGSPLLPPRSRRVKENVILADYSSEAGLGDLVRRSVALSDLPAEAYKKWKSTFIKSESDEKQYAGEISEIETLLEHQAAGSALKSQPLQTHLKIKSIINRKKRKRL